MAQVNKISSFKSFTEVKNQEATMKLREENNAKRQETVGKIGAILDEMGLTSLSELDEKKKQALINKMFGNVSEDEAEDIEDELNKLGEPKKLEEGNAFIYAAAKAKNAGKKTFQFNGKTYKVTLKTDTGLREKNEGNAFGAAVKKAKDEEEDEFEIDGKTYKVEEDLVAEDSKINYVTITDGLFKADSNWWVKNKLKVSNEISKALDGCKIKHIVIDIDKVHESVESIDEARSIAKIQYDWSKLTTTMQATAQNWKAAEGSAKEMLLGKLKEMTAQKKALEAELDATIADKDKDLELVVSESKESDEASNILDDLLDERDMEELHGMSIEDALETVKSYGHSGAKAKKIAEELVGMCNESIVSEAFNRLPKDVIGNELYLATKNLANFYQNTSAGRDIDTGVIDTIIRNLEKVKKSVKKFNSKEEVTGTVYEAKAKDLKPNHKYTSDYGEVTFIKLNPDGKTMKLHSKETGEIKTDISNAYNMELIESVVNEGDMTKDYDGFIVLDSKTKKTYKFKYVKGTNNVKVENGAIDKLSNSTGSPKSNFMVHGFVNKGEWNSNDSEILESTVNEAEKFKSTKDFLDFCEEIDGMPEHRIKRIMGKDYIDTPGGFRDEADDYDNDIEEYMISNMGKSNFNELKTWWENNVQESLTEGTISPKLANNFKIGDKIKTQKDAYTITGFGSKTGATRDFEAKNEKGEQFNLRVSLRGANGIQVASGKSLNFPEQQEMLESVVTEGSSDPSAEKTSRAEQLKKLRQLKADKEETDRLKKAQLKRAKVNEADVKSDDEFKEYAMTVLKKAFGDEFDEAKAGEVVDGILKKCGDDYGAAVGMLTSSLGESTTNEAFDADKRVVELAKLLKKQKFIGSVYPEGDTINVFVDSGDTGTTMMWDEDEPGKVRMECEDDSYSETIDDNNDAILNFFSDLDDELDESVNNEAFDANKRVVELSKLLKKQKFIGSVYPEGDSAKVFVDSGDTGTTMMWDEDEPGKVRMECEDDSYSETIDDNNDAILNFFSNLDDELDESITNEAFDANYWEDYHDKSPKITSASKVKGAVEDGVWDWNDNNENGKENEVTPAGEKKVLNIANDFFKAKGYICADIIDAMIAQES